MLGLILSWINPISLLNKAITYFKTWKFKRIFGRDSFDLFYVVYPGFVNPRLGSVFHKPFSNVYRKRSSGATNLTAITSTADTRSIAYLVYVFANSVKVAPEVVSDAKCNEMMDLSFISIGGITNFKTVDLLDDDANRFLDFKLLDSAGLSIANKKTGEVYVIAGSDPGFDHGFIIKIHPKNHRDKTWICCAGFAEWGTSGAAWYLSHNWKEIYRLVKKSEFGIVIKTRKGSDSSTDVIKNLYDK
jgi:hypothetical protein